MNYKIYKNDRIIIPDLKNPVSTHNILCKLNNNFKIINSNLLDNKHEIFNIQSPVVGIEDIRLIQHENYMYFIGNSREINKNNIPTMIMGKYDVNINKIISIHHLYGYEDDKCQKNWSPFIYNDNLLFIYSFSPLVILQPNLKNGKCTIYKKKEYVYNYDYFRGGSQGFYIDDDLYFIIHEITFEKNRVYFHRFIKFNKNLNITHVSLPFYLEELGIEYITGAIYNANKKEVILSYGKNDIEAKIACMDINKINNLFI
jgi:hypothetical protein